MRAGYDSIGPAYRDLGHSRRVRLQWVARLLEELAPGSLVVDLGCGPGGPATRLLGELHRVIGVDASSGQLALARPAAPSAALVQADVTRSPLRSASVDAVASFYALGHVPAERHEALFIEMARWLRPGGVLLTSVPLLGGDGLAADWLGVPMFFGGIGEQATRAAVLAAGLLVREWQVVAEPEDEHDSEAVRFLWLLARKAARRFRRPLPVPRQPGAAGCSPAELIPARWVSRRSPSSPPDGLSLLATCEVQELAACGR